jgi:hypothetical protein
MRIQIDPRCLTLVVGAFAASPALAAGWTTQTNPAAETLR